MKDFFEPRLKFPPHLWHRQLGYKIHSFCMHVCRSGVCGLVATCLYDWLRLARWQSANWRAGLLGCYVRIQCDICTMACATCIVHSGRLVQCDLSYAVCIVNSGTFAMLFMYIVYCGDWLICSLHWLGHNASCDRPDIHTIYTNNYNVCTHCQVLYISAVWIMIKMIKQILCWDIDRKMHRMCQQLVLVEGACNFSDNEIKFHLRIGNVSIKPDLSRYGM